MVGLSGGKESDVLIHLLDETFGRDSRVELVAISIHGGIGGHRDGSLDDCRALTADRDLRHEEVPCADELGAWMDESSTSIPRT